MSSQIKDKISSSSNLNQELLQTLSETNHAPLALQEQEKTISDIQQELCNLDTQITTLEAARKANLKDHTKYRDSTFTRLAYRASGRTTKFETKAEKEEEEYHESLEAEHRAKSHRQSLLNMLSTAESQRAQLLPIASTHAKSLASLTALYDSIFAGPTPESADEDLAERNAQDALETYHVLRTRLDSEVQTLNLLETARQQMTEVLAALDELRACATTDLNSGGIASEMLSRPALSRVEKLSAEVAVSVERAAAMSSSVRVNLDEKEIAGMKVTKADILNDGMYDIVFAAHAFHAKVKEVQVRMREKESVILKEWRACKGRVGELEEEARVESGMAEKARAELLRVRQDIFEEVLAESR